MNVMHSARQATTSLFNATTTTANVLGECVSMVADLAQAGRAHTRELAFAQQVKEAARKPYIKKTVATEATVDLVKRQAAIQKELNADPELKALYDSTYAEVEAAIAHL